jgi:hypothetical protein
VLPSLARLLIEIELPQCAKSSALTDEPHLANERKLNALPSLAKLSIDTRLSISDLLVDELAEKMDTVEDNLTNDRTDKLLPRLENFNIESAEPTRQ